MHFALSSFFHSLILNIFLRVCARRLQRSHSNHVSLSGVEFIYARMCVRRQDLGIAEDQKEKKIWSTCAHTCMRACARRPRRSQRPRTFHSHFDYVLFSCRRWIYLCANVCVDLAEAEDLVHLDARLHFEPRHALSRVLRLCCAAGCRHFGVFEFGLVAQLLQRQYASIK